jgi:hypothetical protein
MGLAGMEAVLASNDQPHITIEIAEIVKLGTELGWVSISASPTAATIRTPPDARAANAIVRAARQGIRRGRHPGPVNVIT